MPFGLPHSEQKRGGVKADHSSISRHIRERCQMSQVLLKVTEQTETLAKI